jgi:WD40 repeat protein
MQTTIAFRAAMILGLLVSAVPVLASDPTVSQSCDAVWFMGLEAEFELHREAICSLAISPNARLLATGQTDGMVSLIDLVSRKVLWRRDADPTEAIGTLAVAFTRDAKSLVVASEVEGIAVWRVSDGVVCRSISESALRLDVDIATHFDQNHSRDALIGTTEKDLVSWSVSDGKTLMKIMGAGDNVASLSVAECGGLVAAGLDDGKVIVYEWASGTRVYEASVSEYCVCSVALSPNGQLLITADNSRVMCWDLRQRGKLWSSPGISGYCDAVAISPDGSKVVSGTAEESHFVIRDICSGTPVSTTRYGTKGESWTAFVFSSGGTHLAAGSDRGRVTVWRLPQPLDDQGQQRNETGGRGRKRIRSVPR